MGIAIVTTVRVLGSLPVLRWPFVGAIIAIFADASDVFLLNLLDMGAMDHYQQFDKAADQVYMLTFLIVALRWQGLARDVAVGLYGYRLIGFIAFEVTGVRALLLVFPNLFEFWFLFVASLPHWRPRFELSTANALSVLPVLLVAKEGQEFVLHGARWLDSFTAIEALQAIWHWLTIPFRIH
jgi:hypothetical protein